VPFDDDAEETRGAFRPPPHPDDRLWRHPSEIGAGCAAGRVVAAPTTGFAGVSVPTGRRWGEIAAAGLVAAVVAGTSMVVLGIGQRVVERHAVSQVAIDAADPLPVSGAALTEGLRDRVGPATVALRGDERSGAPHGSGVVVRDDGIVLTGAGVLGDRDRGRPIEVHLRDGSSARGTVVGTDRSTGIGVVDLGGEGYPTAVLAERADLGPGDVSYATAAPADGADTTVVTASTDVARRHVDDTGPDTALAVTLRTDRPDDLGVGGPVVDRRGTVVGITVARKGETAYVMPVEVATRVADDLLSFGRADHGWLGIEGVDAPPAADGGRAASATSPGLRSSASGPVEVAQADGTGAQVVEIVPTGPAERAGVRRDDVIVAVDDRPVTRMADLVLALRTHRPGDGVELTVRRDHGLFRLTVELRRKPPGLG